MDKNALEIKLNDKLTPIYAREHMDCDTACNIIFIHVLFHALTQIYSVNFNMNMPIFYTPMTILIYIICHACQNTYWPIVRILWSLYSVL